MYNTWENFFDCCDFAFTEFSHAKLTISSIRHITLHPQVKGKTSIKPQSVIIKKRGLCNDLLCNLAYIYI